MAAGMQERIAAALAQRYRVERELGKGGMAVVYLARDLKHGRAVAVKVMRPEVTAALGPERFLQEIQILAQLNHPNILALHDSGEAGGFLYYVMPFVEGESLRDRLGRTGVLPAEEALQVAREVADALHYAHGQGIIHRDIKPENILFQAGHAVVSDFGIARAVARARADRLTETGLAIGTPAYMSPEQALGADELDGRTDVYAVGCVLWEMLTGTPPYAGLNPQAILAPVPRLSSIDASFPRAFDRIFEIALAKQPDERFATAGELGMALRELQAGSEVAVRQAALPRPWMALAALSLAAMAVVTYLVVAMGLPYWLLGGAAVALLLETPLLTAAARRMARRAHPVGGGARGTLAASRTTGVLGALGVTVVAVGSAATAIAGGAGMGPLSTLISRGALPERPLIVVADFDSPSDDPELGPAIAGAVRDYWSDAETFAVVDEEAMRGYLQAMGREPDAAVDRAAAEEIAERAGAEALLIGEIVQVAEAYDLVVRVVAVPGGEQLLADREAAESAAGILGARDRLSVRLQRQLGEPLAAIRRRPSLSQVTTSSLEALRSYHAQSDAFQRGDTPEAIRLLEQAVELDTGFAMAHTLLQKYLAWRSEFRHAREHLVAACAHRERMVLERFSRDELQLGCLLYAERRPEEARRWARELMRRYPGEVLVVYTNMLMWSGEWEEAAELARHDLRSALAEADSMQAAGAEVPVRVLRILHGNLFFTLMATRQFRSADSAVVEFRYGDPLGPYRMLQWVAFAERDYDRAESMLDSLRAVSGARNEWPYTRLALAEGRLRDAEARLVSLPPWWATMVSVDVHWLRDDSAAASRVLSDVSTASALDELDERKLLRLVRAWALIGRPERAKAVLAAYERRYPADTRNQLFAYGKARADLLAAEGRPLEAVAAHRTAFEQRTTEANADEGWDTFFHVGRSFEAAGMPDSAILAYQRAVAYPGTLDDYATFPVAMQRLVALYAARGDATRVVEYGTVLTDIWKEADPELQAPLDAVRAHLAAAQADG